MQASLRYLAEEVNHWHQALKELTSELSIQDLASFRTYSHSVQSFLLEEYLAQFPDLQLGRGPVSRIIRFTAKKKKLHSLFKVEL